MFYLRPQLKLKNRRNTEKSLNKAIKENRKNTAPQFELTNTDNGGKSPAHNPFSFLTKTLLSPHHSRSKSRKERLFGNFFLNF